MWSIVVGFACLAGEVGAGLAGGNGCFVLGSVVGGLCRCLVVENYIC